MAATPTKRGSTAWMRRRPPSYRGQSSHGVGQHLQHQVVSRHWRIRDRLGPGYRIYLTQEGDALIILFGGSTKRGQQKAIDHAVLLHDEYKARKKAKPAAAKGTKP